MEHDRPVAREHLLDWLRDAHAMEEQAETMLKGMEGRLEHYPELRTRIAQHIQETLQRAGSLRLCVEAPGGDRSLLEVMTAKCMPTRPGFSGVRVSVAAGESSMFSYASCHMEPAANRQRRRR